MFQGEITKETIVIGGEHHNTLGVIRSLGRKGISPKLIVVSSSRRPTTIKSKYVNQYSILKSYEDIPQELLSKYIHRDFKTPIIACSDAAASILDLHKGDLESFFYLPSSSVEGRITKLMDKQQMSDLAATAGLHVPKSFVFTCYQKVDTFPFPCIVKPLVSKNGTKGDIIIISDERRLSELNLSTNLFQVQEYIDKSFEYQLIGCSINGGEVCIIPGRTKIIHQPSNTNTAFLKYEPLDGTEPIEECKHFIQSTGYSGLFSLEFIRGKNGEDYFLEINFRNDGNAIAVTESGINLPYIWVLASQMQDISAEVCTPQVKYVNPEFTLVNLWYNGIVSFREMLHAFRITDVYMDYAKDDPRPTNGHLNFLVYFILAPFKKIIKKLCS